jgi:uncharacterized membrane protein YheB (UPF0754 family)
VTWLYVISPLGCALLAWLASRLALAAMFRPRRPVRVVGLTIHGIAPQRRPELARRAAELVDQEIRSSERFAEVAQDPEFLGRLARNAEEYVEKVLRERVPARAPMAGKLLGDQVVGRITSVVGEQLERRILPRLAEAAVKQAQQNLRVGDRVREHIESADLDEAERAFRRSMRTELRWVQAGAALTGLVIGAAQALLFALAG